MAKAKKTTTKKAKFTAEPKAETITREAEGLFGRARETVEEGIEQITDTVKGFWENAAGRFPGVRDGAEDVFGVFKSAYGAAGEGLREVNLKTIELAHKDVERFFAVSRKIVTAKSVREAMEIQAEYIRTQFGETVKNLRTLGEVAGESARDAFAPIREGMSDLASFMNVKKAA